MEQPVREPIPFVDLVNSLLELDNISPESWVSLRGDRMAEEAMDRRNTSRLRMQYVKAAILLTSAIIKGMNEEEAEKFIQGIGIRRIFYRHKYYIRSYIKKEFDEIWSERPFTSNSYSDRKRAAYTYAPFWRLNQIDTALLNDAKLRHIVYLHKFYRKTIRYGPDRIVLSISSSKDILKRAVEGLMSIPAHRARNVQIRYAGSNLFRDLANDLADKSIFIQGSKNAWISPSAAEVPSNRRTFQALGRLMGICITSGLKFGSFTLHKSIYALAVDVDKARKYVDDEYHAPQKLEKAMDNIAKGLMDIIEYPIKGMSERDIEDILRISSANPPNHSRGSKGDYDDMKEVPPSFVDSDI
jgi:hypothetical protein